MLVRKEAALVSMSALGNTKLVARLAAIYRDEASVTALARIAAGSDKPAAELADRSLDRLLRAAVVEVGSESGSFKATGFAVRPGMVVTADYVAEYVERATVRAIDGIRAPLM
jgi:hypothetical protein